MSDYHFGEVAGLRVLLALSPNPMGVNLKDQWSLLLSLLLSLLFFWEGQLLQVSLAPKKGA